MITIQTDGYINAKEFSAVAHPGFVFSALDQDGDGKITCREYNTGLDVMGLNKNAKLCPAKFNCASV